MSFLVLGLLIVDGTVGAMAISLPRYQPVLIGTVIASIPLFMLTVVGLAVFRPEALRGDRPLQDVYSRQLASDLYLALDGSLRNLEPSERAEAWTNVADVITSGSGKDVTYRGFCSGVAEHLKILANLGVRPAKLPGPVPPTG